MNTVITRRIDGLGRIVIPKEIRNKLKIKYGDCLSIYLENEKIVFKKKNVVEENYGFVENIINIVSKLEDITILITDLDKVIYSNNELIKELELNSKLKTEIMYGKETIKNNVEIFNIKTNYIIEPIIVNGDIIGSVIIINSNRITEGNILLSKIISNLLIKHLEV